VFCAHPGLTRTDHFGKADTDAKWSSAGVERFANSFWGTEAHHGAIPLMYACTALSLQGEGPGVGGGGEGRGWGEGGRGVGLGLELARRCCCTVQWWGARGLVVWARVR
jgi:hypothetical protein